MPAGELALRCQQGTRTKETDQYDFGGFCKQCFANGNLEYLFLFSLDGNSFCKVLISILVYDDQVFTR